MKKGRLLSAITSCAMAAMMFSGTIASNVAAVTVNNLDSNMTFSIVPEKTKVNAGDTIQIKLIIENFQENELLSSIQGSFEASDSGMTISNIAIPSDNFLTINGGVGMIEYDSVAQTGQAQKAFSIMTDSTAPFILSEGSDSKAIVTADVTFATTMKDGTYTVDFGSNPVLQINSARGSVINHLLVNTSSAKITVGDGGDGSDPSSSATEEEPNYVDDIKIWGDTEVAGNVTDEVAVNFYADTNGNDITSLELKLNFDSAKLSISGIKKSLGLMGKLTTNDEKATYIVTANGNTLVTNDPKTPIMTITFKILSGDAGEVIPITISGTNGRALPYCSKLLAANNNGVREDLKPVVTPASVKINGTSPTPTDNSSVTEEEPNYVDDIKIWGDTEVTGNVTDEVAVNFYADTNGNDITSLELKLNFDSAKLSISGIKKSLGLMGKLTTNDEKATYVVTANGNTLVTNDPKTPIMTVTFKILSGDAGEVIPVTISGTNGRALPYCSKLLAANNNGVREDLKPVVTPGSVKISSSIGGVDELTAVFDASTLEDASAQWYHSDNVSFFADGIVVKSGDKDISHDEDVVIKALGTPGDTYDGKNSDYTVEYSVTYGDQTVNVEVPVKIGLRGDANLSYGTTVDLYDCIAVARQLVPNAKNKYKAGSWEMFISDNNEDGKLDLYDCIRLARRLVPANKNKGWDAFISNYNDLIQD